MTRDEQARCPNCGAVHGGAPDEPCAACLLRLGLDPEAPSTVGMTREGGVDAGVTTGAMPATVGGWRPIHLLGEGGMGVVYLAEELGPLKRRGALKRIKHGRDSKLILDRFDQERRVLARMDHPCIARAIDAGSDESGAPFFVMEYVPGAAITVYCDTHRLGTRDRLALFARLCEAVDHAHRRGILHRDLKPSNILVHDGPDGPQPKVIDFGVARAVSQRRLEWSVFTEFGRLVGTPEYMSPEQADLDNDDLDTRSDVYGLGVILYELLVGKTPHDPRNLRELGLQALLRTIREGTFPTPSSRLSTLGDEADAIAERRNSDPGRLRRGIVGELDWIVMRATERDRERRYGSPRELGEDIERYLDSRPVQAGPPSTYYRAKKFVRRHRVAVTLVAAALIVVVGFALRERVQAARIAREAEIATQVSDFLVGLFNVSDPSEARGDSITAREILDQGALRIERELEGQPELQAHLMDTIGSVYIALGLYPSAEPLLQRARENLERTSGRGHPSTLRAASNLARLYELQGRYDEAEAILLEVLRLQQRKLRKEHPDTLNSMNRLAVTYASQGRYDEAEPLMLETFEIRRRLFPEDHMAVTTSRNNLAGVYEDQGRYGEAEPLRLATLEVRKRTLGDDHPETLRSMNNLANLYTQLGRYGEVESLLGEVLTTDRRVLGDEHPDTLRTLNNLAYHYINLGQFDDAEPLLLESVETKNRVLGPDHSSSIVSLLNLARVYTNQRRFDEAEELYLQGLEAFRRVLGGDHAYTLTAMNNLAVMYVRQERYDDAEPLFAEDLEVSLRVLGPDHPETLVSMGNLGDLYNKLGRFEQAEKLLAEAQERVRDALPLQHVVSGYTIRKYGSCLAGLGRYAEAEAVLLEAYEILVAAVGQDDGRTQNAIRALAELYEAWGRPEQAEKWRSG